MVPLQRQEEEEIVAAGDLPPVIAEGPYDAVIVKAEIQYLFDRYKMRLDFDVRDVADPAGGRRTVRLARYYNIERRNGRPSAGRTAAYRRDWSLITGRRPTRDDRLPPSDLVGTLVVVKVETVTRDAEHLPLAPVNQYSCVRRIIEVVQRGGVT